MSATPEDLRAFLEVMQVKGFEASLAELNSTLVDILTNQGERDLSAITGALTAAIAQMGTPQAPTVNTPITVQPAEVKVVQATNDWTTLSVEFRHNAAGRICGMDITRNRA